MLLHILREPTSRFESLKQFDDEICRKYQEACFVFGLLADDQQREEVSLEDASISKTPKTLRCPFCYYSQTL